MKRILTFPVGLMGALALAGCGSSGATGGGDNDASTQTDTGPGQGDSSVNDATMNGDDTGTGAETSTGDGATQVCGDGIVEGSEQCDDGTKNGTAGDPCTASCQWVCIAGDPVKGDPACNVGVNPCVAPATCQANHTCMAGAAVTDGTICGGSSADGGIADSGGVDGGGSVQICKAGTCIADYCGDGVVVPGDGKDCDFGTGNGAGTGCEINCKFSCTITPSNSCPQSVDICAGTNACTAVTVSGANGQKCVATPATNGTVCDGTGQCQGGTCSGGTCGNGKVDPGEQCDWGTANNIAGSGCEPDCTFSCQTATATSSDTCATSFGCEANPKACQAVADPTDAGANSNGGQKCQSTTQLASCAPCNTGASGDFVCVNQVCTASHCSDSCLDTRTGEQCDDGNTINLDGCDSTCKFEQDQRATSVAIATTTDSFCGNNDLANGSSADAGALTGLAVGIVLGPDLQNAVNAGTSTIAFKFMGITDLSGQSQTAGLSLGALTGNPVASPTGTTYDGGSDEDWWYTTSSSTIDNNRNPISLLPASFTGGVLSGAGSLDLTVSIAGTIVQLNLIDAKIQAKIGASNTPLASSGNTPGHLASEHLVGGLKSFESMSAGLLCGDITAASLANAPVPGALTMGTYQCTEGYSANLSTNSLLDVLVNGCHVTIGIPISAVNPKQPDQFDPSAPSLGMVGGPYKLVTTGNHVTSCQDHAGNAVPAADFAACLQAAAYSSYFNFTSDRVIMK